MGKRNLCVKNETIENCDSKEAVVQYICKSVHHQVLIKGNSSLVEAVDSNCSPGHGSPKVPICPGNVLYHY